MTTILWLALLSAVTVGLVAFVRGKRPRRRPRVDLDSEVRAVAVEAEHGVLMPNGMGGHIEIEHLLLTAGGVVVVDTKHVEGTIFGSDLMDEWTAIHQHRRFTFANPQHTLYDRVAAVRRLVGDVPVQGHVVFPPLANFSKGRPRAVMLPAEFAAHYRQPDRNDIERVRAAFGAPWQQVKAALQPAETRPQ